MSTKECRATKFCEESVKSEPEPKSKRLKSVPDLGSGSGSEQKHGEDSHEEEKRLKPEPSDAYTSFMKWLESEQKFEEEDSEYSDDDDKDFSVYDDSSEPFMYRFRNGTEYTNKAWKKREAQVADYEKRSRGRSVYDAISYPPDCGLAGGVVPLNLSGENVRPTLKTLCNAALKIYNQNNNNQGPTFVFHKVVKCTHPAATSLSAGMVYYITFQAKAEAKAKAKKKKKKKKRGTLTTFQTHVVQCEDKEPDVKKCVIKI